MLLANRLHHTCSLQPFAPRCQIVDVIMIHCSARCGIEQAEDRGEMRDAVAQNSVFHPPYTAVRP